MEVELLGNKIEHQKKLQSMNKDKTKRIQGNRTLSTNSRRRDAQCGVSHLEKPGN